jgi:hypothetical protein
MGSAPIGVGATVDDVHFRKRQPGFRAQSKLAIQRLARHQLAARVRVFVDFVALSLNPAGWANALEALSNRERLLCGIWSCGTLWPGRAKVRPRYVAVKLPFAGSLRQDFRARWR